MQCWAVNIHDLVYGGMFLILMGCEINLACFLHRSPNSNILSMGKNGGIVKDKNKTIFYTFFVRKNGPFYKFELMALWIIAFLLFPVM